MNINKFVFMARFCNVDEYSGVSEATGHKICRRQKKIGALLFYFYLKNKKRDTPNRAS
jgi:hypothetical protein